MSLLDYIVIGGGIVGASTALALVTRNPGAAVLLLEKEAGLACHQTGRNSGVIHTGLYYAPGSLKARYCRMGREETVAFCARHGVRYEVTGKLLVASDEVELARAKALMDRGRENGVSLEWLDDVELSRREPCVAGRGAILVHDTGIVDYVGMTTTMCRLLQEAGGVVRLGERVTGLREDPGFVVVATQSGEHRARRLIACAGLQSDRLAHMMGLGRELRIVPFRGEYYRLAPRWEGKFRHLVYPVPDPSLPFLGVHLTRMIDGSVTAGPNAVLGLAREGYARFSLDLHDASQILGFRGFWRFAAAHLRSGLAEFANSLSRRRYLELCRKYCPDLVLGDLLPYPAGIRAQAMHSDGRLEHDFVVRNSPRAIHVCNAPSPAATSALPIGRRIVEMADERLAS